MMEKHFYIFILALAFILPTCFSVYAQTDDEVWMEIVNENLEIVERERQSRSESSVEYLFALYNLVTMYYSEEQYYDAIEYGLELDSLYREDFGAPSEILCVTTGAIANAYSKIGQYSFAANQQSNLISLSEYVYNHGGETFDGYKVTLPDIVENYLVLSTFLWKAQLDDRQPLEYARQLMEENNIVDSCENAWNVYTRLFYIYKNQNCKDSSAFFDCKDSAAIRYVYERHNWKDEALICDCRDSAMLFARKALNLIEKKYGKESEWYKPTLKDLAKYLYLTGLYYYNKENYQWALFCFGDCDSLYNVIGEDTTDNYISNYLRIIDCQTALGWYTYALTRAEMLEPIVTKHRGKDSYLYVLWLGKIINIYNQLGLHDKANYYNQINWSLPNNDSEAHKVDSLGYTAYNFYNQGNFDSAEYYYNKYIEGLKSYHKSGTHFDLLYPYRMLLKIYAELEDAKHFDSIQHVAVCLFEQNDTNDKDYNRYLLHYNRTMAEISSSKRWVDGAEFYWAQTILLSVLTDETGGKEYLDAAVKYCYESFCNKHTPAWTMQNVLIHNTISQYILNYIKLTSDERDKIVDDYLYTAIPNMVFSLVGDSSDLISVFDYTLFYKQQTLSTDIYTNKVLYASGVEGTSNQSPLEERSLRRQAQLDGAENWLAASYDSVRQTLGDKDLAVEYVRYYDFRDAANDSYPEMYVALLARKDWAEPKFVTLCTADELKSKTSLSSETIYSGGYVSSEIVRLLFDPIKEYTKKGGNVYFSPDGVIYNLAIENILTDDGMTLGEKYGLVRCSSTRNIAQIDNQPQYASAVLYGGLDYGDGIAYVAEATTRKGWNYLPGTLQEVTTIGEALKRHKIKTEIFTEKEGTEDSFARLSGRGTPIIHLATHGFFYTVSSSRREAFFDNLRGQNSAETEEISPMQRSGLLLSGGNKTWVRGDEAVGSNDGVLLASEVMNMNLFGTKLLVLSACETGLGDMSVEGILGLQRAFKLAGVETIVMSLWKVDDAATSMMMEQFYEGLMSGKSKRKAFSLAQQKVRKMYPKEPQKWAAFIMLD